jgi:peptidoglycan/xylan/chitin deacetylase (PgdA/CDA1 family)
VGFTALMYHSLSDGQHPDRYSPKYTTTLQRFREHLAALHEAGYRLCSAGDLVAAREAGQTALHHACVLTFDDGHRSSLDMAEAMAAAGARGTFFLTKEYCEKRDDFLKPEEIRHLAAQGFDFGTHGTTHRPLREMPQPELEAELKDSRHWLEDLLGKPVFMMSLPAGQGGPRVIETAFRAGYRLIGNSRERNNTQLVIPGQLNRFVVLSHHTAAEVTRIASASPAYMWKRRLRAAAIWLPKKILRPYRRTRQ